MYLLIHFHCNLGYVFLSFDWIKTIIIIIIIIIIIVSDPQSRPQMIPWKIEEWNGFMGLSTKKDWLEKEKEDARSQASLYEPKKME